MSNSITILCRPLAMTPPRKAVLMALADFAHDDGMDWHSQAAIAEWTCLSKRAVIDAVAWLEAEGFLRIERRNGTKSRTALLLDRIRAASEALHADENRCMSSTGAGSSPVQVVHQCITSTGAGRAQTGAPGAQTGAPPAPEALEALEASNTPPTPRKRGGVKGLRFEEFWLSWPKNERKQDRAKCWDHWRRNDLDEVAEAILADVRTKRGTTKWTQGFIEAPLVYLRGKRWEDGVVPEAKGGTELSADEQFAPVVTQ